MFGDFDPSVFAEVGTAPALQAILLKKFSRKSSNRPYCNIFIRIQIPANFFFFQPPNGILLKSLTFEIFFLFAWFEFGAVSEGDKISDPDSPHWIKKHTKRKD